MTEAHPRYELPDRQHESLEYRHLARNMADLCIIEYFGSEEAGHEEDPAEWLDHGEWMTETAVKNGALAAEVREAA